MLMTDFICIIYRYRAAEWNAKRDTRSVIRESFPFAIGLWATALCDVSGANFSYIVDVSADLKR